MRFIFCFILSIIILAVTQLLALVLLQFVFININFWIAMITIPPICGIVYKGIDYASGKLPYAIFKFRTMKFWNVIAFSLFIYSIASMIWYPNPLGLSAIPQWVFILTQVCFMFGAFSIHKQVESLAYRNKISREMDDDLERRLNVRIKY